MLVGLLTKIEVAVLAWVLRLKTIAHLFEGRGNRQFQTPLFWKAALSEIAKLVYLKGGPPTNFEINILGLFTKPRSLQCAFWSAVCCSKTLGQKPIKDRLHIDDKLIPNQSQLSILFAWNS